MDRDMMVERYLGRRMSAAEEIEFRRRLGVDPELRGLLEAEQTIQRTLRRDRDALPAVSAESRFNVLTMLGKLPSAESGAVAGGQGISMLAGGVAKGIIIAVAGIGIAAGGILISRGGFHPPVNHPAEHTAPAHPASIAPLPPALSDVEPQPAAKPVLPPESAGSAAIARRSASSTTPKAPAVVKSEPLPPDPAPAEAPIQKPLELRVDSTVQHRAAPRDTTMRVKVTIDMNKLRHP